MIARSVDLCTTLPTCESATSHLVYLLDGRSTCAGCLVDLHHDGIHHSLDFLLLAFELVLLSKLIFVKPVQSLLDCLLNFVFVTCLELVLELLLLQGVAHREAVVLQ